MKKEFLKLTSDDFYRAPGDIIGDIQYIKGGSKMIYEASTIVLMNGGKVSKVIKNRYGLSDSEIRSMVEVPDRRLLISQL
jgi:hypothetical protein